MTQLLWLGGGWERTVISLSRFHGAVKVLCSNEQNPGKGDMCADVHQSITIATTSMCRIRSYLHAHAATLQRKRNPALVWVTTSLVAEVRM
jgi:hypothetical protein